MSFKYVCLDLNRCNQNVQIDLIIVSEELRLSLHRLNILLDYAVAPFFQRLSFSPEGVGLQTLRDIPLRSSIVSMPVFGHSAAQSILGQPIKILHQIALNEEQRTCR